MSKVRPSLLRGFDQEYRPDEQLLFNGIVDTIRKNFERCGFWPIETPSAERIEVLTSKGGVEKEIYALTRLAAGPEEDTSAKGALRFDLTVPLARYVAMRQLELAFPFRRYQIQRVWRGETPQANKGRFREFYQCDIDIINREKLSYLAEAEIPSVIYGVFKALGVGEFRIRINNRKILRGLLQRFDVPQQQSALVLRTLDKVEKEDAAVLIKELERAGMKGAEAANLHEIISTRRSTDETLRMLAGLAGRNQVFEQGLDELNSIVKAIGQFGVPESAFCVDLSVVRGLDYYTGTIYETTLLDHPELGSVCSGGRYDDLAGHFTDTKLPGVGISIGLTRLFSKLKEAGLAGPPPRSPSEALVTTMDHRYLDQYLEFGRLLRQSDINTEIYLEEAKLKKQLEYANKKGFRVAIIAGENEIGSGVVQVKNLVSQTSSDFALDQMVSGVKAALEKKGS